jgi:hypothetical protein
VLIPHPTTLHFIFSHHFLQFQVNPVKNSGGALNPAGIIIKTNPAAAGLQPAGLSHGANFGHIRSPLISTRSIFCSEENQKTISLFIERVGDFCENSFHFVLA